VKSLILEVVKNRKEKTSFEKDLLQMVIEGANNSNFTQEASDRFIIDNCRNIYLAGFETTAVAATWCLMLLALNHSWQDRARAEVLEICKGKVPDFDMLSKMKQVWTTFILTKPAK
jgi:cytochrome P450